MFINALLGFLGWEMTFVLVLFDNFDHVGVAEPNCLHVEGHNFISYLFERRALPERGRFLKNLIP